MNPYLNNTESAISAIPIPGKLLKANQLEKEVHSDLLHIFQKTSMSNADVVSELKINAPYIVSKTGKEEGNTKLWMFSVLQLKKHGFEVNYEKMVHNVIMNFLNCARRPHKDHAIDGIAQVAQNASEAKEFFDMGESFNVEVKEFVLDTNVKFDIYSSFARFI